MRAYCVPTVSVAGVPKVAVNVVIFPLLFPAIVVLARSAPVGSPNDVALIETVRFGFELQAVTADPQKRVKSTFTTGPVTPDVNVCAAQLVLSIVPVPIVVPAV